MTRYRGGTTGKGTGSGAVSPDVVLPAFEALTWREVPLFRVLMGIRSAGRTSRTGDRPVLDDFTAMGFTPVVRTGTELVYAGIGRPWSPTGGMRSVTSLDSFRDFTEPGWAKMAVDFRADNDDFSGAILGDEGGV
jgi:hypothetical protein